MENVYARQTWSSMEPNAVFHIEHILLF